ncbi:MAG: AmmeMemoRadiSam system protein B [Nitrospinota bacterium]|nr:AmmeMemoRadiSam system protein B [Nitrospinota bacterium]
MDEFPRVRSVQAMSYEEEGGQMVALNANDGLADQAVVVSLPAFYLITLMDGSRDINRICGEFQLQFQREVAPADVENLVNQLDKALMLDNDRYRQAAKRALDEFLVAPVRAPVHAGKSYPDQEEALSSIIEKELADHPAAGADSAESVIVPHIDFRVGAAMMAEGWREIPSGPDNVIVILGTGHYLADDFFACIDKDFETPLGPMEVDREFLAALGGNFGEDLFKNRISHKAEHSIEFQALFMASRARKGSAAKAVPILLSFPENIWEMDHLLFNGSRVDRFVASLVKTAAECGRKVRYVASVDFSHVGARFGDEEPLTDHRLRIIEREDRELMEAVKNIDAKRFLSRIREFNPKNRICGFPPLYVLLNLTKAKRGKILDYRQNLEGEMESVVSFASMALYE